MEFWEPMRWAWTAKRKEESLIKQITQKCSTKHLTGRRSIILVHPDTSKCIDFTTQKIRHTPTRNTGEAPVINRIVFKRSEIGNMANYNAYGNSENSGHVHFLRRVGIEAFLQIKAVYRSGLLIL